MKCDHVDRVQLHPSIKVGGFGGMGKCGREVLPLLVVCAYHATPDAIRMAMVSQEKKIAVLREHLLNLVELPNTYDKIAELLEEDSDLREHFEDASAELNR